VSAFFAFLLARRRPPDERFLGWVALGALVYGAGFLVAAPSTDNRYNWLLIATGTLCACTSAGQAVRALGARRPR